MTPSQPAPVTDGGQGSTPTLSATPYYPDQSPYPGTSLFAPPAPFPPVAAEVSAPPAQVAAQAWAAAMRQKKQPCVMPPWQENTYCLNPVMTAYPLTGGVSTLVAPQNPQRVALFFARNFSAAFELYLSPGKAIDANNPMGILIRPEAQPVIITQKDHLVMAQLDWYALATAGGATLYVTEVVLRDWPTG